MSIEDFDPVFRKKDLMKVRQSVLKALHVYTGQDKGFLRLQGFTGKNKLHVKFASKLKE